MSSYQYGVQSSLDIFWDDWREEYDGSDRLEYRGLYKGIADAPTDAPGWVVMKYTWTGGNLVRRQVTIGAWDDRATLF